MKKNIFIIMLIFFLLNYTQILSQNDNATFLSYGFKLGYQFGNDGGFVFDENYKLKDLNELEKEIKQNKRLPNIPSEKEIKESGVNLGEMQAKMMQKIEELTLYMIQQQKKINELETLIKNK